MNYNFSMVYLGPTKVYLGQAWLSQSAVSQSLSQSASAAVSKSDSMSGHATLTVTPVWNI